MVTYWPLEALKGEPLICGFSSTHRLWISTSAHCRVGWVLKSNYPYIVVFKSGIGPVEKGGRFPFPLLYWMPMALLPTSLLFHLNSFQNGEYISFISDGEREKKKKCQVNICSCKHRLLLVRTLYCWTKYDERSPDLILELIMQSRPPCAEICLTWCKRCTK